MKCKKKQSMKMADEDEIDILGDFSFNSCFAQNNQGIPSCSNREDTVHPQWLLDSTATNWYDKQNKDLRLKDGSSRKLMGNSSVPKCETKAHSAWTQSERELLVKEMAKYGRNVCKISQTLKTKTQAEIQALIEAEYGINLDTPSFGIEKTEYHGDVPAVVQEEIVTDDVTNIKNILKMVATGSPTIIIPNKPTSIKKIHNIKASNSLLKPDILVVDKKVDTAINPSEIFYEDDLIIGSTESIGSDFDLTDIVSKNMAKYQAKVKAERKIGNHRRKVSRNYDTKPRNRSKDLLKSPPGRQRKDSTLSDDSVKSPKMQIVLGSGQALPVSEGEQVIKIEKKKDSEPESDIDIDVNSDNEETISGKAQKDPETKLTSDEAPIAMPLRKFEPMPRRHKKINLDGGGGYTIMHTEAGDMYQVGSEPRRERHPRKEGKKQPVPLIQCRVYNSERPAPYEVHVHVSTLILMDCHAHSSRGEVMGLAGGVCAPPAPPHPHPPPHPHTSPRPRALTVCAYRPAAAAAGSTHCDMDPVSQSLAAESLRAAGLSVCGWHHSHPAFPPAPSAVDLRSQRALQLALEWSHVPFLGFITSQHWPTGRTASQYRCIRVEDEEATATPTGFQFSLKLDADLTDGNLQSFLQELRSVLRDHTGGDQYTVDMSKDICPQAGLTYLEKCISSVSHHLHSAGYTNDDPIIRRLIKGITDIFR